MRTNTYTYSEMINIASMPNDAFMMQFRGKTIDSMMRVCRLIRISLAQFSRNNKDKLNVQLDIVNKAQILENYCRPYIYKKHFINIVAKYPNDTPERHKELTTVHTEKTMKKYTLY